MRLCASAPLAALSCGLAAVLTMASPVAAASAAPLALTAQLSAQGPPQLLAEGAGITTSTGEFYTFTVGMRECGAITTNVSGSCVASLQRMLNVFLPANLVVDAMAGPATVNAIRQYQQMHGLPVNGVVAEAERLALMSDYQAAWAAQNPSHNGGYAYNHVYNMGSGSVTYADSEAINKYVVNNFRSVFPTSGNCPDVLYVGLRCDLALLGKGNIEVTEIGSRHFSILSLPGHLEGANRRINFTFTVDGPTSQMVVAAQGPTGGITGDPVAGRLNGSLFVPTLWESLARRISNLSVYGLIR